MAWEGPRDSCKSTWQVAKSSPGWVVDHLGQNTKEGPSETAEGSSLPVRFNYTGSSTSRTNWEPHLQITLTGDLTPGCWGEQMGPGGCGHHCRGQRKEHISEEAFPERPQGHKASHAFSFLERRKERVERKSENGGFYLRWRFMKRHSKITASGKGFCIRQTLKF